MKRIILFICIITLIFTTQISATQTISNIPSKYNQSLHMLGNIWQKNIKGISKEQLNIELENFYEYAVDDSIISGKDINDIILDQVTLETKGDESNGSNAYGNGTIQLPSKPAGHMFYIPNGVHGSFVGHIGLYTHPKYILQAWSGTKLASVNIQKNETKQYYHGKILGQPGVKAEEINEEIKFAESRAGRPYDKKFLNNKKYSSSQDKAYNCSEIIYKVWNFKGTTNGVTYKYSRDLDGNGGNTVYPSDIYKSPLTKVVDSF